MKTNLKIIIFFVSLFLLSPSLCKASFFEMNLKQDSIYTPGKINLTMKLTSAAKIENDYKFKVSIFLTGALIREQTIEAGREKTVTFELTVPEVFDRTEGRCRCELLIGNDFLEAQEVPLFLWPAIAPYKNEILKNKEIWVYDASGKLLDLFKKMEVKIVDATFKTARDFGKPDIVFVGENTDANNMQIVVESISSAKTEPVVIYLRQKQFLKEAKIEVPKENNISQNVKCVMESSLLKDLSLRDILRLVDNASFLKFKKENNNDDLHIDSFVTEEKEDENNIYSYLCTVQQKDRLAIYCQLPVTEGNDPISAVLLKNILNYTATVINEIKAK